MLLDTACQHSTLRKGGLGSYTQGVANISDGSKPEPFVADLGAAKVSLLSSFGAGNVPFWSSSGAVKVDLRSSSTKSNMGRIQVQISIFHIYKNCKT